MKKIMMFLLLVLLTAGCMPKTEIAAATATIPAATETVLVESPTEIAELTEMPTALPPEINPLTGLAVEDPVNPAAATDPG